MAAVDRPPAGWRGPLSVAVATTAVLGVLACWAAVALDLPLRDPDGVLGPSYVRLPLVVLFFLLLDLLPRSALRAGGIRAFPATVVAEARQRWPRRRLGLASTGLAAFYVSYVAYRNLKSFLPFLRPDLTDAELLSVDRRLLGGSDAATLLHQLLGTGVSAHVLSSAYLAFLVFVPVSLAVALIWSDDLGRGMWYVSALCLNWALGTACYYLLPSLGPVYVDPATFAALPETGVSALQRSLLEVRLEVLSLPRATDSIHGIAAFASLHVSVVFTAALMAQLLHLRAVVRYAAWVFFLLTVLATLYFGWHYVVDDLAGMVIGALSVWLAALGTDYLRASRDSRAGLLAGAAAST